MALKRLSWKMVFLIGISILCFLNMKLSKIDSKTTKVQNIEKNSKNMVKEKKPLNFEEKINSYREQKKLMILDKANEEPTVKRRSVLDDQILKESVNIKRPTWIGINQMDQYFQPYDILALGKKRKKKGFVVFGIPTVARNKAYYLLNTLKSLVESLKEQEKQEVVFVVFIADFDRKYREKVIHDVQSNFAQEVESGMIQVLVANERFYPDFSKLPRLYGDNKERVTWRSKQCLDYSFLYYYCADIAEYYTQLEDDITAQPNYLSRMREFIEFKGKDWSVLEFGARGFIGMTYHTSEMRILAKYVRFYFWTMPVDWLFRVFNDIFLHGNNKQNVFSPPLFLHVGAVSSLNGQKRKLEDLRMKNRISTKEKVPRIFQSNNGNPEAIISSSIQDHVEGNDIYRAYSQEGMFWGKSVKDNDMIEISLKVKLQLKEIVFVSGTKDYPDDVFGETELFVAMDTPCSSGYKSLKTFSGSLVKYSFGNSTSPAPVKCIKLVITKIHRGVDGNPKWLVIPEIALVIV